MVLAAGRSAPLLSTFLCWPNYCSLMCCSAKVSSASSMDLGQILLNPHVSTKKAACHASGNGSRPSRKMIARTTDKVDVAHGAGSLAWPSIYILKQGIYQEWLARYTGTLIKMRLKVWTRYSPTTRPRGFEHHIKCYVCHVARLFRTKSVPTVKADS